MGPQPFGLLLLAALSLGQGPAGQQDFYATTQASARELARQLQYLEEAVVAVPRPAAPPGGDGLFQQVESVQAGLILFRQQMQQKLPREQLIITYDAMDAKLNQLLGDIQAMEKWDAALRMVVRRVKFAQSDLHFAVFGADTPGARQADLAYRQTLVLVDRIGDLEGVVRYVFNEKDSLPAWNADFAALRGAVAEFQKLQKAKASRDEVQKQLAQADKAWEKLVARFNALPAATNLLLGSNFSLVDQSLDRLSRALGVKNRRAPLRDPFA
jgi:hypothetical protein